ncbi:MAG: OB-fold domain-containing protein [Actinomycetota bacterium]|nr:OB-fold domain-containing protein [Actinomycetota bacterium]
MTTILASGAYLPQRRLDRAAAGIGRGARSIASFDEDATSLAVEAARRVIGDHRGSVGTVVFCTTSPPYADRTNATVIHQALDLDQSVAAYDAVGSVRTTVGALRAAADGALAGRTTLLVAADVRVGLPGSADERDGGDGAAALVIGPGATAAADLVATGSASAEFLDRWRVPGELTSKVWEERFGETEYVPLADAAFGDALKAAGLAPGDVDHLIVTGLHTRAVGVVRKAAGVRPEAIVDDRLGTIGITGAAHPIVLLTDVLEQASPGQVVALLVLADGADCLLFRTGDRAGQAVARPVREQLEGRPVDHTDVLVWRGLLRREPPRRPDPDRPAAPPSSRNAAWKYALVGSRCTDCGTRHLPPERVCLNCRSRDHQEPEPLADLLGTVTTFAIDHLAFTLAPPVVAAVVDFDGGGRIQCELTDVDPNTVAIGDRVAMTFRRLYTTADGVHNYFWKARPIGPEGN